MATESAPLVIDTLTKRFGDVVAVDSLSLTLAHGEVFGFLGPNGAGKTTTIRVALGLLRATSGHVRVFGKDAWRDSKVAHRHLAYVPGETSLWPELTGLETLHALAGLRGGVDAAVQHALIERFEFDPSRRVRAYSKGNRQKLVLIAAFASRAPLLILDEPSNGLDPLMEKVFRDTLEEAKRNGQTIFLSSHILSEVEAVCDRVGIVRSGALVEVGTLAEMRHLSSVAIAATFDGEPPDVTGIHGVSDVRRNGVTLHCQVTGPVAPVLTVLAAAHPIRLTSKEPSLEELFLTHYGSSSSDSSSSSSVASPGQ